MTELGDGLIPQLHICTESFLSNRHGRETRVAFGMIAEACSWPLEVSPGSFKPLTIDFPAQERKRIGRALTRTVKRHLRPTGAHVTPLRPQDTRL
jgi:hypothetical protein